jgi:large subunit ribosomal protein L1
VFTLEEAADLVRKLPGTKFNQTVTLSFRMGVDPRKSDQMVRGTCPLPHGLARPSVSPCSPKGAAADAAKAAGAELSDTKT